VRDSNVRKYSDETTSGTKLSITMFRGD